MLDGKAFEPFPDVPLAMMYVLDSTAFEPFPDLLVARPSLRGNCFSAMSDPRVHVGLCLCDTDASC